MVLISKATTFRLSLDEVKSTPLKGWRFKLRNLLKYLGYGVCFFMGFHRIKINGKRATKDEAKIFVLAPHSSAFDGFAIFALDLPCGVSRLENGSIPVVGTILRTLQPIFVTREHSKKREEVINEIKKRTEPESGWPQLCIFPGMLLML
jgi:lysophosphatidylcholine acyltransferase/lyso-PAF acetyltransferase